MRRVVVLDAGPLGLLSNPRKSATVVACSEWSQRLVARGVRIVVPEIADYEIRRELLRVGRKSSVEALDAVCSALEYLPITTTAMKHAARLWAETRRSGRLTAPPEALDGDVILVGQALEIIGADELTVATSKPRHLSWFLTAQNWEEIA